MPDKIDINGHSRRFQLVVLLAAVGVVITALIAVGAVATAPGDFGVGLSDSDSDEDDERDIFSWLPGGSSDNGNESSGTESEQEDDSDSEEDSDPDGNDDMDRSTDMPGMLDATEDEWLLPTSDDRDPLTDQFSSDSFRSFVSNTHFTTDSTGSPTTDREIPKLWRGTSYDSYTGDGFTDSTPPLPEDSVTLDEYSAESGDSTETDTITLRDNASQIPAPGDVTDVEIASGANPDEYEFKRTPDGSVVVTDGDGEIESLPEGTELHITHTQQTIQSGEGDDPGAYTDTTDDVPDRVGEKANDIISSEGADSNEEAAHAISDWLGEEKEYRADADHDGSGDAADEFLFESDGGHSEHFATTTTVMLREEGVPARTVTGYSPTGDDGNVGSMDKHSWVEVYDEEDDEWVAIDPTPSDREQAYEDTQAGDETAIEYGVEEDVIDAWQQDDPVVTDGADEEDDEDVVDLEEDSDAPGPPYDIDIHPDPTPGAEVTVTVTSDGTPIHGAEVTFNGDSVGTTGPDGTLTAQVPYTDELTVDASEPGEETSTSQNNVFFSGGGGAFASTSSTATDDDGDDGENGYSGDGETYDLPTNVTVDASELVVAGEPVETQFTIAGNPVPGVDVYVNGDHVGTTDNDGRITVEIPSGVTPGESVTIHVERDELSSETTVTAAEPQIEMDTGIIALPGTTADVTVVATDGDTREPVENQTITVEAGGEMQEITVDEHGETTISLPWENSLTVETELYGASAEATVTGLYYRVGAVAVGLLLFLFGGVAAAYRRGITVGVVREKFYAGLFAAADIVQHAGEKIVRAGTRVYITIHRYGARFTRWGRGRLDSTLKINIRSIPPRFLEFLRGLPDRVRALFSDVVNRGSLSNNPPEITPGVGGNVSKGTPSAYERVQSCWRWLVRFVIGRTSQTTKTTVEIADAAIEKGLPAGPVTRLRRAYQDIEYGFIDPTDRIDDAEETVEELRTASESKEDTA